MTHTWTGSKLSLDCPGRLCVSVSVCVCLCLSVCLSVCLCVCTHTYVYTHTQTHTHTCADGTEVWQRVDTVQCQSQALPWFSLGCGFSCLVRGVSHMAQSQALARFSLWCGFSLGSGFRWSQSGHSSPGLA
jgi:hypothetical protein